MPKIMAINKKNSNNLNTYIVEFLSLHYYTLICEKQNMFPWYFDHAEYF